MVADHGKIPMMVEMVIYDHRIILQLSWKIAGPLRMVISKMGQRAKAMVTVSKWVEATVKI